MNDLSNELIVIIDSLIKDVSNVSSNQLIN